MMYIMVTFCESHVRRGGLVGRALAPSKVGSSNPRSGQVKDLKIGTCCFPG